MDFGPDCNPFLSKSDVVLFGDLACSGEQPVEEKVLIAKGKLRGEKARYEDGIGYCVWYPFTDKDGNVVDEDAGMCFDFPDQDIDDLIALLEALKVSDAREVA